MSIVIKVSIDVLEESSSEGPLISSTLSEEQIARTIILINNEIVQLDIELIIVNFILIVLILLAELEDKGEDVVFVSDGSTLILDNGWLKVGNLGCDSTEGGGINCNFGSGRIEDDSLFTSFSLFREELGFVGSSAECGSSQNPSVISLLVGDWESD